MFNLEGVMSGKKELMDVQARSLPRETQASISGIVREMGEFHEVNVEARFRCRPSLRRFEIFQLLNDTALPIMTPSDCPEWWWVAHPRNTE